MFLPARETSFLDAAAEIDDTSTFGVAGCLEEVLVGVRNLLSFLLDHGTFKFYHASPSVIFACPLSHLFIYLVLLQTTR